MNDWQTYKSKLINSNPFNNEITNNFLQTRKMTSAKILLPMTICDILNITSNKEIINDVMHYIYFVRASDDIIDDNINNINPQRSLEDISQYGVTGDRSIFNNYDDKSITATAGYLLRSHLEKMSFDSEYIKSIVVLGNTCKQEFSNDKNVSEKARLEVCGLYVEGIYNVISSKTHVSSSNLKNAMYTLGLASRFYDDLSDESKYVNKNERLYTAKNLINKSKQCFENPTQLSKFSVLTNLLQFWWFFERNIKYK